MQEVLAGASQKRCWFDGSRDSASSFYSSVKQYWKKIAWQTEQGSLMFPMASPWHQQVHRSDLHQQSAGDIAHFPKKKYIIPNLYLVFFSIKVKAVVVSDDDMKMRISPSYLSFIPSLSQVKNFPQTAIPNNLYNITFLYSAIYPPNIMCLWLKTALEK